MKLCWEAGFLSVSVYELHSCLLSSFCGDVRSCLILLKRVLLKFNICHLVLACSFTVTGLKYNLKLKSQSHTSISAFLFYYYVYLYWFLDSLLPSKGESGLGKSTLINSLFLTDLYPERIIPGAAGKTQICDWPSHYRKQKNSCKAVLYEVHADMQEHVVVINYSKGKTTK